MEIKFLVPCLEALTLGMIILVCHRHSRVSNQEDRHPDDLKHGGGSLPCSCVMTFACCTCPDASVA